MMQIMCICMECCATVTNEISLATDGEPNSGHIGTTLLDKVPAFGLLLPEDNGVYRFECSRGHKSVVLLQSEKFEILFETALYAIIDNYYREAVTSFAASLERFYETCIDVLLIANSAPRDSRALAWKKIARSSERQLGAFVLTYLAVNGSVPATLSDKAVEFRNSIVHQGVIPSEEEALKFGNQVRLVIESGISALNSNCAQAVMQRLSEQNLKRFTAAGGTVATTASSACAFSLMGQASKSVEEWVADRRTHRESVDEVRRALSTAGIIIRSS